MKNKLEQRLIQAPNLSPQQIKAIRLLSFSEMELLDQVDKEIEENPALEKETEEDGSETFTEDYLKNSQEKISFAKNDRDYNRTVYENTAEQEDLYEILFKQLGMLNLSEEDNTIAQHIIASLNDHGFLRLNKSIVISDLKTDYDIDCSQEKLNSILGRIQTLEPIGCGSSDVQEFLIFQLSFLQISESLRKTSKKIILSTIKGDLSANNAKTSLNSFLKSVDKDIVDQAYKIISSLKTRPFEDNNKKFNTANYFADFIIRNSDGLLVASLYNQKQPNLIVNKIFKKIYENPNSVESSETKNFIKDNIDRATFFIEAIKKRRETLQKIIVALAELQSEFFLSLGDASKLKPMIINDVAKKISMHPSTVSRAITNKFIRTDFGIISIKYLFSNKIESESGDAFSNKDLMAKIKSYISTENSSKPYTDEQLTTMLNESGYKIARRTVAKYREQIGIPISSLRKR